MKMKGITFSISLVLLMTFLELAGALTMVDERFRCPIDGTQFTATVPASGTTFGQRLDLRPLGPTPAPWTLPVCPKCHFVLYEEELDRPLKKKLRPFIHSEEYQLLASEHSTYFLLARIYEYLKKDDWSIATTYLQASWEVEDKPERYRSYLRAARDASIRAVEKGGLEGEDQVAAQFLIGEIDRQLRNFESAEAHFQILAAALLPSESEPWQRLVAYELKLIAARDSAPHESPRE